MPTIPRLMLAFMTLPSEDWLPPSLARLPSALLAQSEAFAPKRRRQFLVGRWLLAELMHRRFGYAQLPEMGEPVNGRPSFVDPSLPDFNLSHSGQDMMVAIAQGCRVGVDIEQRRPRRKLMELARYSFSEEEYLWLTSLPEEQRVDGFWRLWTLRESILKLSAKGVWQMKQMAISPSKQSIHTDFEPLPFCYARQNSDTFWSVASDKPLAVEQVEIWQMSADTLTFFADSTANLTTFTSHASRGKV